MLAALHVAVLVVPHIVSYVLMTASADLRLPTGEATGLVMAGGLALPALLLTVPPAALAARRFPAWSVLAVGLVCVFAGAVVAREAGSVPVVGLGRAVQGAGAGFVVPATLVLAWERRSRALVAAWAGALVSGLIMAMPVALRSVPATGRGDWRAVLHPPVALIAVAFVAAVLCALAAGRRAIGTVMPDEERTQLMLPLIPSGGFCFLALVTTCDHWPEGALLVVAAFGVVALVGLAVVGARNAEGGELLRCSSAMAVTGLAVLPVVAPVAGLISLRTGASGLPPVPFALGAAAAIAAALVANGLTGRPAKDATRVDANDAHDAHGAAHDARGVRGSVNNVVGAMGATSVTGAAALGGHGLLLVALMVLLTVGPGSGPSHLALALVPLGAGAGIVLATALREVRLGSALFGLSLWAPAVLVGYLVIGPLQMLRLNAARASAGDGPMAASAALTSAFRLWMVVAAGAVVLSAVMTGQGFRTPREAASTADQR